MKFIRYIGGAILSLTAAGLVLLGIGGICAMCNSDSPICLLATVVCFAAAGMIANLAACCFSAKHSRNVARRDYKQMVSSAA